MLGHSSLVHCCVVFLLLCILVYCYFYDKYMYGSSDVLIYVDLCQVANLHKFKQVNKSELIFRCAQL